uniref:VWFA domain-containing protein n=1 Tax=Panagrellus redivivus TaxID=6233 RepID=A0A7E4UZ59_PANRE
MRHGNVLLPVMPISVFHLTLLFYLNFYFLLVQGSAAPPNSMFYSLDMGNVNSYLHRSALMALLRVKAKSIMAMPNFPNFEKLIYSQCARDAKTPVRLARCVVMLIDAKNNMITDTSKSEMTEEARNDERKQQFLQDIGSIFLPSPHSSSKPAPTEYKYKDLQPIKDFYEEKIRVKRDTSPKFKYLADLDKLHVYTRLLQKCKSYMERVNGDNTEFIRKKRSPVRYQMTEDASTRQPFDDFFNILSKISDTNIALLSPRVLSFWPSKRKPNLMSPSLLSFEDDGVLSIPQILRTLQANDNEKHELLELLLELSGAGPKLTNVVSNILPHLEHMEQKVYPAILEMEQLERKFAYVKETLSFAQQEQLRLTGYAHLQPEQMALIYESSMLDGFGDVVEQSADLSTVEREKKLESDIRQLATLEVNLNQNARFKRQEQPGGTNPSEELWPALNVLRPWAFLNRINEGVVLEAIILSPHAFFTELAVPEVLNTDILSPRAFQPAILSPAALLSRVLSPLAFGAEVLSPRALVAYVLSPEAFTAEVLSPQFMEAHILSPEAFGVQILSPNIMGPRIASPEANSILVLSPNILSPRILSGERMLIEILSPHILGGEETEEEEESNLHNENELPEAHKYHKHSQGRFFRPNSPGQPETHDHDAAGHADHPGHAFGIFP